MNRFENITKPLMWFMALLLTAFVAGCGGGSSATPASTSTSADKAIKTFSLAWTTGGGGLATGIIDPTLKTIKVTVPYGTLLTPVTATFTTTGASVTVDSGTGPVPQVSGVAQTPPINYTLPVSYKVTAADGTWATYTVLVTVAANTAKAINTFTLADAAGTPTSIGTVISGLASPFGIAVTMPYGTTDLTALVATFTTTGSSVKVGTPAVTQVSGPGGTQNDFTGSDVTPVVYTVTAANGTTATYNVSVTVALNSAKAITAFTLAASGVASTATAITGSASPFDILVTMPNGTTDLTQLVATFTAPAVSSVKVGTAVQTSGISQNDFSAASGVSAVPVAYVVTAADSSTATYNVTVTVSTTVAQAPVNLLTAGNYVIFSDTAIGPGAAVSITGDIAVGPGVTSTAITGFSLSVDSTLNFATSVPPTLVVGKVYAFDYKGVGGLGTTPTVVTTASTDMLAAYNDAAGRPTPDFTELYGGDISGKTLVPGLYKWGTNVVINTDVTLSGSATDVWIFQIAQDLTVAAGGVTTGIKVLLGGQAKASNVFWQVGGPTGATLGTYSTFEGNILSAKQVIMGTGAVLNGRALAQTAVSMDANTVTAP